MTATPACPQHSDLRQLLLGQLSERDAVALEAHFAACDDCLRIVEGMDLYQDSLLEALRSGPTGGLEAEADSTMIDRLCRLRPGAPGSTAGPSRDAGGAHELAQIAGEFADVGPYRVIRQLGSGGMGVVYEAEDTRLKRVVALKMILAGDRASPQRLARFRREAEVVARLQHPNIAQVYDAGDDDGRPYYAMELVNGGSLSERLADRPMSPRPAAELVETLARAVEVAHERGVLHRDLKPGNILLAADGTPKISDFGLARQLHRELEAESSAERTRSGEILGTPSYMAPEQATLAEPRTCTRSGRFSITHSPAGRRSVRPRCWKRWTKCAGRSRSRPGDSSPTCRLNSRPFA